MASGRRIVGTIRSLVNARSLRLECARVLHEPLLVLFLMYSSETMIWKEKERHRIRTVKMDTLSGFLGDRNMDKVLNAWIRELCGMMKWKDGRIDEGILRWFYPMERIKNDRLAKMVYLREFAGSRSVGRPRKRWIDTMKDCLQKRGLDIREGRRMVHNRSV